MPAASPPVGPGARTLLEELGAGIRARRKELGVSATTAAEAAGMSRVTLHRIEKGEPSVTIGAVAAAAHAVGLVLSVVGVEAGRPAPPEPLPAVIPLADFTQLKRIAWQLGDLTTVTPREALSLYERNWRHVDVASLDDVERAFLRRLVDTFGGRLLV